ncbi:MAG: Lrp/AsnC ligand binding domain-containing protein [Candidatus ainarchaeum sp.]|nr:Lrp/AsnC ligand binding domain-containing protein [Candidatus ainarchaeum sp.]
MKNGISVFIGAVTDEKVKTARIVSALKDVKGVQTIYEITGALDILILAQSDSIRDINELVEAVRACEGVKETTTYLVLETTSKQ